MELGPILRAMTRNKTGAILIALQIAFTMTVVVNGWVMIEERLRVMDRPSGLAEDELFHISVWGFAKDFNGRASVIDDLALLRQSPGISNAVAINAIPLSGGGWAMGLQAEPGPMPSITASPSTWSTTTASRRWAWTSSRAVPSRRRMSATATPTPPTGRTRSF